MCRALRLRGDDEDPNRADQLAKTTDREDLRSIEKTCDRSRRQEARQKKCNSLSVFLSGHLPH